jgi:hypothetical protein
MAGVVDYWMNIQYPAADQVRINPGPAVRRTTGVISGSM